MQERQVQSLVQEDPTSGGATNPGHHNYWAYDLYAENHNHWTFAPQLLKLMRR